MAETKKLSTTTVFNIYRPYVEILTYYDKNGSGEFLFFFISQFDRTMEGTKIGIGDLVMRAMGGVEDSFYVNENGDLMVESNNPDQYEINRLDDQLIQTTDD